MKHDTSWTPLCVDRSQEYVDAVLSDPEWKNKSADKRLGEVMRRSKGSVNPRTVWFLLTGNHLPMKGVKADVVILDDPLKSSDT